MHRRRAYGFDTLRLYWGGDPVAYLFCITAGYLIGMINPSYLLGKYHGVDVRREGSGNAGASNAVILFGRGRGVLCAGFDIAKAVLAIRF
ncbi:MAG: glycerol-3-phosphate acyltransferase, partial [Clostridia bacterium]|nr:glycerol-3-phosphate acyltransferase [Clostridia bacterium]